MNEKNVEARLRMAPLLYEWHTEYKAVSVLMACLFTKYGEGVAKLQGA